MVMKTHVCDSKLQTQYLYTIGNFFVYDIIL
jgi:hypothetical protein